MMDAKSYQAEARRTVKINWKNKHGPDIAILGAIGELGSLASVLKKQQRDQDAYSDFKAHFAEEIGDLLWYVTTIASRINIEIKEWPILKNENIDRFEVVYTLLDQIQKLNEEKKILFSPVSPALELVVLFDDIFTNLQLLSLSIKSDISHIAYDNIAKTIGYWGNVPGFPARNFDKGYPFYESLPRQFDIEFLSLDDGKSSIMRMNGVQLGDRLTDNSYYNDGYRFHDVFHIAGAGLLGWSPVFRRLLKAKRKSKPKTDEVEDG